MTDQEVITAMLARAGIPFELGEERKGDQMMVEMGI